MEFLSHFLPIIIYFLLIIIIIIGIVLGIKLIITIDKVFTIVDNLNDKVEKVTPIFNALGVISDKFNGVVTTVVNAVERLIAKVFVKNKKETENEENE